MSERDDEDADDESLLSRLTFVQDGLDHLSSNRLHRLLRRVDPAIADTLHPNNRRKIIRSVVFVFCLSLYLMVSLSLSLGELVCPPLLVPCPHPDEEVELVNSSKNEKSK